MKLGRAEHMKLGRAKHSRAKAEPRGLISRE